MFALSITFAGRNVLEAGSNFKFYSYQDLGVSTFKPVDVYVKSYDRVVKYTVILIDNTVATNATDFLIRYQDDAGHELVQNTVFSKQDEVMYSEIGDLQKRVLALPDNSDYIIIESEISRSRYVNGLFFGSVLRIALWAVLAMLSCMFMLKLWKKYHKERQDLSKTEANTSIKP